MIILKLINLKYILALSFFGMGLLVACDTNKQKSENFISEGIIEYKADVINMAHPLSLYAPSDATLKLKNNNWVMEMSKMGFFNIYYCCNLGKGTLTQMIKCLDIKNACIDDTIGLKTENDNYLLTFKHTDKDSVIAGYKCKKVIATKVLEPQTSFAVYYTEDIGPENGNELTPYKALKGMPMDYRIMRLGLEMRFIATSVKKQEIKDADFEVPSFYKILTREKFDDEFNKLFADFL